MLFNSYIFIFAFFPIVLLGYFGLNHFRKYTAAKVFLIAASLYFYGYFNWSYLLIIMISVGLNYLFSRILLNEKTRQAYRKAIFALALTLNIGSLLYFKYYDFFISNINALFKTDFTLLHLLLPLGISFFTFQQLSYVIDSYKHDEKIAEYNFFDYALFITYFPQLIAGPIVTHDEMVPQFADFSKKRFDADNFAAGLYAFTIGLGKKVIIADSLGLLVNQAFSSISSLGTVNATLAIMAYTFQMYFDFSGYSDMATGIGKMMNIDLVMNFNSPYKSITIVEFWKRWHITLNRFFTKYVYFPLGGSRRGTLRTYVNVMIVFMVSGIWHGANWTFFIWGTLHGIANVITRMIDKATGLFSKKRFKVVNAMAWFLTFTFVNLTFIIFRADSLEQALEYYSQFFNITDFSQTVELLKTVYTSGFQVIGHIIPHFELIMPVGLLVFVFVSSLFMKNTNQRITNFNPSVPKVVFTSCTLVWCIMSFAGVSTFLYWNF